MDMLNGNLDMRELHIAASSYLNNGNELSNGTIPKKSLEAVQKIYDLGHLKPAAIVDCSKEQLFTATNTIAYHWSENECVQLLDGAEKLFLSSSSVGDIFVDEAGKSHMYGHFGTWEADLKLS
jgi:hypothetical protein